MQDNTEEVIEENVKKKMDKQTNLFEPAPKIISEEEYENACLVMKSYYDQKLNSSFIKGKVSHINGTLRQVIKRNKENIIEHKQENIQCLIHCIGQLNIL